MKRLLTLLIALFSINSVYSQLATYTACGGTCTTVVGVANETVTNLLTSGFGSNTPCSSGGLSGLTVNTSWSTYSTAGPRVYIKITPNAGYMLNMTSFTAGLRKSGTGPACARFAYSLDNGSTWIDDGGCHVPNGGGCGATTVTAWSGGALPTGVSSTTNGIIVAIFPYQSSNNTGTFQVNSINIGGNVTPSCVSPTAFSLTGGGSYCSGGSGVTIGLSGSQSTVTYQLYRGATAVGTPVAGSGSSISFGLQTVAGTYTVLATGSSASCTTGMTGSATVVVNTTPSAITGSASICQGLSSALSSSPAGGTWSSSNTAIAAVNASGSVTGVTAGSANITYTMPGSCIATTTVTVNPAPSVINGSPSVCEGQSTPLSNTTPGGVWSSSSALATITGSGVLIGNAPGTATISYSLPTCNPQTLTITVNPLAPVTGSSTVCVASTITMANINAGGSWSSSNTSVANVVPGSGVVTGVSAGTADITYTLPSGCTSFYNITVNALPAAIGGAPYVCQGATTTLSNAVAGGAWSSSNSSGMPVNPATGVVSGVAVGTATISYGLSTGCFLTQVVTVNSLPAAITGATFICQGGTSPLGNSSSGGVWTSGNPSVASISSTGMVTGMTSGTANITYALGTGCTSVVVVTVNPSLAAISGSSAVCQGLSTALSHTAPGGVWSTANSSIVTVNAATGIVTGVAPGVTLISYSLGFGCTATIGMTVITPPTSIAGPSAVCVGNSVTLSNAVSGGAWSGTTFNASVSSIGVVTGLAMGAVVVTYSIAGCTDMTRTIYIDPVPPAITGFTNVCQGFTTTLTNAHPGGAWASSSSSATVSPSGVVTGVTAGASANITYTLPTGCYVYVPVIIDSLPAPISGVDSVCPGATVTFTDVTTGGLWSSSNGMIATSIALTGEVIGVSAGTVMISYTTLAGCYQTHPITVLDPLPASVNFTISPDTAILCSDIPVTFSASSVNGGAPSYEWQIFGVTADTGATFTYIPTHGDYVSCIMTPHGVCAAPAPSIHSTYMNVYPNVGPVINISTGSPHYLSFIGEVFTFFSLVTYGGSTQTYQWYRNGIAIPGATSHTYATPVFHTDAFYCIVKGNPPCSTIDSGVSNTITITSTLNSSDLPGSGAELTLYPNPNSGNFILEGDAGQVTGELELRVTNMLGQVVYAKSVSCHGGKIKEQTAVTGLAEGLYILHVGAEAFTRVFYFRVALP